MLTIESVEDVQDFTRGAVLLGTGGGGNPYLGELFIRAQFKEGRYPRIIPFDDLDDNAFALCFGLLGAAPVLLEHLLSRRTLLRLLARAEAYYGRSIDALVCGEIGGVNSMIPLALSAISGLPVLDADGVGRAVPQLEMTTFSINGCRATPCVLMDDHDNVVIVETESNRMAEDLCRAASGTMGAMTMIACYPMSGQQVRAFAVHNTLTQTLEIGRTIRKARESEEDVFAKLTNFLGSRDNRTAKILFDGKISDVTRETRDGFHWGQVTIQGAGAKPSLCIIDIRNEYLVARIDGRTVTIVPDLIAILDSVSAEPLTAERLAYGQRVKVLGYAADQLLRRPESMAVLGPRMFGLDEDFQPIEQLTADL